MGQRRLGLVLAGLLVLVGASAPRLAHASREEGETWRYVMEKLVSDGVDRRRVETVFSDDRTGSFSGLEFSLDPRESSYHYRSFLSAASVARARQCRQRYAADFESAQRRHGVPASVLSAIIHVETQCGRNTGSYRILPRLARLAMAAEPANVQKNIRRHLRDPGRREPGEVENRTRARARYLEETFYPEVRATFVIADRMKIDPLNIRGSSAGALGLPQFLPSSFLRFGVDGNGNQRVSLYEPADAIQSCANYLAGHGWRQGLPRAGQRRVIWAYNRSDAYIDTVLALADRIDKGAIWAN